MWSSDFSFLALIINLIQSDSSISFVSTLYRLFVALASILNPGLRKPDR